MKYLKTVAAIYKQYNKEQAKNSRKNLQLENPMQLFTLEDKSKVEIRICAAHSGCNTNEHDQFWGVLNPVITQPNLPISSSPQWPTGNRTEGSALHSNPSCGPRRSTVQSFGIVLRLVPQVNGPQRQELIPPVWVLSAKGIRSGSSVLLYSFADLRSHLTTACLFTHSPINPTFGQDSPCTGQLQRGTRGRTKNPSGCLCQNSGLENPL